MVKAKGLPVESLPINKPETTSRDDARERKYRAEEALRDIERAEGHRRDKDLMRDVKACAKEKKKTYDKL